MAGNIENQTPDRTEPPGDPGSGMGGDGHVDFGVSTLTKLDNKVMRQALRLHKRRLAERRSDKGLLDSYSEAVEIGMHETWF